MTNDGLCKKNHLVVPFHGVGLGEMIVVSVVETIELTKCIQSFAHDFGKQVVDFLLFVITFAA